MGLEFVGSVEFFGASYMCPVGNGSKPKAYISKEKETERTGGIEAFKGPTFFP